MMQTFVALHVLQLLQQHAFNALWKFSVLKFLITSKKRVTSEFLTGRQVLKSSVLSQLHR